MPEDTNYEEYVTEDALDTVCRIEELFLTLIHQALIRLNDEPHTRVNRKAIDALQRLYQRHGRIIDTGSINPKLPDETITAMVWAGLPFPNPPKGALIN